MISSITIYNCSYLNFVFTSLLTRLGTNTAPHILRCRSLHEDMHLNLFSHAKRVLKNVCVPSENRCSETPNWVASGTNAGVNNGPTATLD